MTALPDWMVLPEGLSVADYEALPEDICRRIEVVDGYVAMTPAPRRRHQRIVGCLWLALREACDPRFEVNFDVDLRLRDVPLLNRRPDVVVYDSSLPEDTALRPQHCLLLIEVMAPGSITPDRYDKPAEYAAAGIEHYWRFELDDDETHVTAFRYQLNPATGTYNRIGTDTGKMVISHPFELQLDFSQLR